MTRQRQTMPVQAARPKSFQDSRQQLDELDEIAEGKLAQDLFGLPAVFNAETQKRNAKDECTLCQSGFSLVSLFGVGNKEVQCKRCGNSVCNKCSKNKRPIARLDPVSYTVCDKCDTELDNVSLLSLAYFLLFNILYLIQVWLRYSMHTQMKTLEKKAQILQLYLSIQEKRKKEYQDQIDEENVIFAKKQTDKRNQLQKLENGVTQERKKIARLDLEIDRQKAEIQQIEKDQYKTV